MTGRLARNVGVDGGMQRFRRCHRKANRDRIGASPQAKRRGCWSPSSAPRFQVSDPSSQPALKAAVCGLADGDEDALAPNVSRRGHTPRLVVELTPVTPVSGCDALPHVGVPDEVDLGLANAFCMIFDARRWSRRWTTVTSEA